MKDEQFEKYWQEKFEHFESAPSEKVWDKMGQELFVRQSKLIFKDYLINPSARVWKKIAVVLWWNRFTRFSPYTFNVYYLLVAVFFTFTLGSFFELNNYNSNKLSNLNTGTDYPNNPRSASVWLDNTNLPYEELSNKVRQNTTKQWQGNYNNSGRNVHLIAKNGAPYIKDTDDVNVLESKKMLRVNQGSIRETFNYTHDTALKLLHHRSLSFYFAPVSFKPTLSFNNLKEENVQSNYKPIESNIFSNFALTFYYEWQHFNFKFKTGVSYQSLSESFIYRNATLYNDTLYNHQLIDNSYYDYSYIQVLNLDSLLLTGDTVWITYIDSTLVPDFDTLLTTTVQTKRKYNNAKQKFSISAIEIPFITGYSYSFGRFDITLKAGSSISYVLLTRGYLPSAESDYGTEQFKKEKMYNFYINLIAGAEANYFVTDKLSLSFMPLYRHNVTRLIKNDLPLQLNLQTWSFNLGIKYQIR